MIRTPVRSNHTRGRLDKPWRVATRRMAYEEGFRQHMHVGLSARDADRLSEALKGKIQRGPDWW